MVVSTEGRAGKAQMKVEMVEMAMSGMSASFLWRFPGADSSLFTRNEPNSV